MTANGANHRQWVLSALEEHECRLTRYALRLLADEDLARDAVQHAFLRLCDQDAESIGDRVAPWLYTVCRNKAFDILRGNGRVDALDRSDPEQLLGREADPAAAAEHHDLATWLRELVEQLPDNQREVIVLWIDGFRYQQIAEITGHSVGHARVLAHRALTSLRGHPRVRALLEGERPAASQTTEPQTSGAET